MWFFFFFNDTATTEIYTLSLHDALPIWGRRSSSPSTRANPDTGIAKRSTSSPFSVSAATRRSLSLSPSAQDRKSTRLNSSHANISYAVFCLKKKKTKLKVQYIYRKKHHA